MFSKILFGIEVVALIAAPVGYLKLREYRAEQFFDKGEAALREGNWNQAYTCYQEAARRDNKTLARIVACRLTLCKDFGLGVAPAEQVEKCPWHGTSFSDCLEASRVSPKRVFEATKQNLAKSGSTDLIVWVASAYKDSYPTVPQDYDEAAAWYRMAAARGHLDAQRYLISMAYFQQWTPSPGELPSDWLLNTKDMLSARILLGERVAAGDEALAQDPESINWLLDAANDGNAAAQACIGIKLAEGEHFLIPQETATNYVLAAARQGNEKAQAQIVELAQRNIYRDARWDSLPTEWILFAAKQGNEKAQVRIVELIQFGLYTDATWDELPIAWLIAAAQNNNEAAQAHLGAKLAEGETLDLPEEIATDYLIVAAKQGNEEAQGELLTAAKNGNELAQAQIIETILAKECSPETEREALSFLITSAQSGNEPVQAYLGAKLAEGVPLDLPDETVVEYLLAAAKQGDETATPYILATAKQNNGRAQRALLAITKQGNEKTKAYLGTKIAEGAILDLPEEVTTDCLLAAIKRGNEQAKDVLKQAFARGSWKKGTNEETFRALLPYAEADIAVAQKRVADHYLYGLGIPKSKEKAREWYQKAAENGDSYAQWWISENGE